MTKPQDKASKGSVPIGTVKTNTGEELLVETSAWASGGSGIVFKARGTSENNLDELVAVKFYLLKTQGSAITTTHQAFWDASDKETFEKERRALRELHHPGIQEVVGWGEIADAQDYFAGEVDFAVPKDGTVQFLVSRFIDGLCIDKWIASQRADAKKASSLERHRIRTTVVNCFIDIANALIYLHDKCNYQHSDLRAENVVIHPDSSRPVLVDFGYAQAFSDALLTGAPTTRVPPLGDALNAPLALVKDVKALTGSGKQINRDALRGLLFPGLDLYQFGALIRDLLENQSMGSLLSPLDVQFLSLISAELLRWPVLLKTKDVYEHLLKLTDGYWSGASTPHAPQLAPGHKIRRIALPSGSFLASTLVENIIDTRSFRRLQRLKQLSLLEYVYPGATESRFSHSLAVYSTGVELVASLVRSPRFTRLFDTNSTAQLLVTALLHDVNHFPFLHYAQELDLARASNADLFQLFLGSDATGDKPSIAELLSDAGLSPVNVVNVLALKYSDLTDPRLQIIKSVVDSGIDIDKLTYVPADARATGVPFGLGVDRATLLSRADVLLEEGGLVPHWRLCFEPPALSAVESLVFARYWNFKQIYWHKTNRALGAMISHALRKLAAAGHFELTQYVQDTLGWTESEAIGYLNTKHRTHFGEESILSTLNTQRPSLFKRLLSVRMPLEPDTAENQTRRDIIVGLEKMSDTQRSKVAEQVSIGIGSVLKGMGENPLVLLDFPGRPLDSEVFQVYVADLKLDGRLDGQLVKSRFLNLLSQEFLSLSRTARLFISPEARGLVGQEAIAAARSALEALLLSAIKTVGGMPTRNTVK